MLSIQEYNLSLEVLMVAARFQPKPRTNINLLQLLVVNVQMSDQGDK